ncbi:DUF3263 domain-containing protein [Rhodococcus erythropolis]|uniref:DUF3263 domain-containing protein n=1 Tax=Rhodococcus erythropolis TaxID=1833 RepID=UPI002948CA5C|nr:DUF3263 domain-containing protein [Rhodococcus erythropolis]MDV6275124.1 DUF3263 domain-containing protein [Rhodococcus erythropolis]
MSRTDTQEIVEFARKWQQFDGGPDEEIFVTFGLAPDEYFRRLQAILDDGVAALTPPVAGEIASVCAHRLGRSANRPGVDKSAAA